MPTFAAKDIIALFLFITFIILELKGLDGELAPLVAMVVGYYFGERVSGARPDVPNGELSD